MKLRHVSIGAATVLLAFALLPPSSAAAQDDATCIDERTEQVSHGFETTVRNYCARWSWTPPTIAVHTGTGGTGDHDPDGGKGGTPDIESCDAAKQELAEAKEALDIATKQLDAANVWFGDVIGRAATAEQTAASALDAWERAEANVDFFFTAYATANDVDTEIEVEPKHGVTIVRPVATFRPDHSQAFGIELDAAMHLEVATRAARNEAATAYQEVGEELNDARSAVANLTARQAALSQMIERLRSRLSSC